MSDTIHVDRALARRILGGDEAAFRGLFDSFFPRLYRFALARLDGDHEAAREVVGGLLIATANHAPSATTPIRTSSCFLFMRCLLSRTWLAADPVNGRFIEGDARQALRFNSDWIHTCPVAALFRQT